MKFTLFQNDANSENNSPADSPELSGPALLEHIQNAARHVEITVKKAEATAKRAEAAAARAEGLTAQVQQMLEEVVRKIEEARALSLPVPEIKPDELKSEMVWEEKQDQEKFGMDLGIPRVSPYIVDIPGQTELSEA